MKNPLRRLRSQQERFASAFRRSEIARLRRELKKLEERPCDKKDLRRENA